MGELRKDKHIQEQKKLLDTLCEKGYLAMFACGIDEARYLVCSYLAGELRVRPTPRQMRQLVELIRRS